VHGGCRIRGGDLGEIYMKPISEILADLPADIQADLADRPVLDGNMKADASPNIEASLAELTFLASMLVDELLDVLGRWTQFSLYLHSLVIVAVALEKRLAWHQKRLLAELRGRLRTQARSISNQEIEDAIALDPVLSKIEDAMQALAENRAVLEHRERSCRSAAEAASRAITAKGIDLQQMKLEARRG
jgi:hypothetical protein